MALNNLVVILHTLIFINESQSLYWDFFLETSAAAEKCADNWGTVFSLPGCAALYMSYMDLPTPGSATFYIRKPKSREETRLQCFDSCEVSMEINLQ